ncbi:MAG: hypothetical protein ABIT83_20930 [Massilia sp.]
MDDYLDMVQWPAMVVTLYASYLLGSKRADRRIFGFCMFILSNVLWIVWGWHDSAWALIALQTGLLAMNIRGIVKNEDAVKGKANT